LSLLCFYLSNQRQLPLSEEEQIIFELLGSEILHANELARLANLDITVINSRLTIMEMKGLVRHLGSMNYVRERQPKS
jgi:predicted Rossmann fold nucleotide-binding protein DprA/Smf involved in DNA uptake